MTLSVCPNVCLSLSVQLSVCPNVLLLLVGLNTKFKRYPI